ncbi:non-hydrolyzing UDP-N-acetylglucosamine 2-epimerase [Marinilactibacillus sp. Marseille-P9653]|uniref:non-hydrolyzing UDP-N-acetylglucosamine 2-epimerase n=1 Tax=Marinilactibacillus sp. Marseille-P9653 TaxID=2866583 RepID=UPI001CE48B35|nr:UDP-N-acetylglucosamine 2-epimerase (non-hydrolyzing) [Marinilactibacillus sp. Marseille-P9653]
MNKKKIALVFGTRPEAIKMAPVIKELEKHPNVFQVTVIVTAQHREMLDQVLKVFEIKPNHDLNIMKKNQTLSDITINVMKGLEERFITERPDMVLVHGDTTTSFAAALAAYYQKIPIGHVEAGLRTYDKYFPFPEEANRQLIDNLADLFFVPTELTKNNLLNEHKPKSQIIVTGNTAIDAIQYTKDSKVEHDLFSQMTTDKKWVLLTMHRRENHGEPMKEVFQAIRRIVDQNADVAVVMPVHMSPVVQEIVEEVLAGHERILLVDPLEVDAFHKVMSKSYLILTDSGGLQEEAPALNIPVLVLRDKTERPEGQKAGTLKVIGTNQERVYTEMTTLLNDKEAYLAMAQALNPYGDGTASQKIAIALKRYFELDEKG